MRGFGRLTVASLAALLAACGNPNITTTVPWTKPATFEGDTLYLTYWGGTCRVGVTTDVEESSEQVVVTIRDTQQANCTSDAARYPVEVALDAAVGDRAVVDGACEQEGHRLDEECQRSPRPVEVTRCSDVRLPANGLGEADLGVNEAAELLDIHFSDNRQGEYRNVTFTIRYLADPSCRSTPGLARLIDRVNPAGW